jgi:hypothetical protein
MDEKWSVWEALAPAGRFFKGVGDSWLYGVQGEGPFRPDSDVFFYGENTPLVARMLSEVKTGWSLQTVLELWGPVLPVVTLFALGFCASMLYCVVRIAQIRRIERTALRAPTAPAPGKDATRILLRWQQIQEKVTSDDPQHWRIAILEADELLNELLDVLGYKGETMSDKMRQVNVAAFNTIDYAWEAHQIRNRISQDTSFVLDAREAKRIVRLYERVFKEFKFIQSE